MNIHELAYFLSLPAEQRGLRSKDISVTMSTPNHSTLVSLPFCKKRNERSLGKELIWDEVRKHTR